MVWRRVAGDSGPSFYSRLNEILDQAGFDRFCEVCCAGFYHAELGRPSLPPASRRICSHAFLPIMP